jgi:predicted transcriptional regulator
MTKNIRVVDIDTGEDLSQEYTLRHRNQDEAYHRKQMIDRANEVRSQKHYVNCYHGPIKDVTQTLKLNELGALIKLLPYLRFKGAGLLETKGKPMTAKDIAKAIGKSERMAKGIIANLIEEGILVKEGERKGVKYFVAEHFHTIGYTLEGQAFTKLYQRETRLRADKLSIQEAGLLYKIIPYFHYQTYFLCANPDANQKTEELVHLNQAQLADKINESRETVKRGINSLMTQGFVMKISSFNTSRILVNPDVMFRAEYETAHTDVVRKQFDELAKGDGELPGQILH